MFLSCVFVTTTAHSQTVTQPNPSRDGARAAQDPSNMTATPTDSDIREWLKSDNPRLTAWGAHAVLEQKRSALLPDLNGVIDRWEQARGPRAWDWDHLDAMLAVLDAVIQMNGTLSAGAIQRAIDGDNSAEGRDAVALVSRLIGLGEGRA